MLRDGLNQASIVFAIVLLFLFALTSFSHNLDIASSSSKWTNPAKAVSSCSSSDAITGVTGKLFEAKVIRTFPPSSFLLNGPSSSLRKRSPPSVPKGPRCEKWAVVTTIHAPGDAILDLANGRDGWCLVVVGDEKTPEYNLPPATSVFLDVGRQKAMLADFGEFMELLPWRHFGRKNVGFLYAIQMGASSIWDFDDDNGRRDGAELRPPVTARRVVPRPSGGRGLEESHGKDGNNSSLNFQYPCAAFNPYPLMGAPSTPSWPRGFPLSLIKKPCDVELAAADEESVRNVGVFQSLANHEPDVDGIFRLTLPIPFNWDESAQDTLVLPPGVLAPYNAQAQLSMRSALWALLLPVSVHGRVSDIWRAYFAQRLLWDVGQRLAFTPPRVTQVRNVHDALADMQAERDLYEKSLALVKFLREWRGKGDSLPERYEELYVALYERDFIGLADVLLAQQWLLALKGLGYEFPSIVSQSGSWE